MIVVLISAILFRPRGDKGKKFLDSGGNPAFQLYQDLYGDQKQPQDAPSNPLAKLFGKKGDRNERGLSLNLGIPDEQYIQVTYLNQKYDSYRYSLTAATQNQAAAAAVYRQNAFSRRFGRDVSASARSQLQSTEQKVLEAASKLLTELQSQQTLLAQITVDTELQSMGLENPYQVDPPSSTSNTTSNIPKGKKPNTSPIMKNIQSLQKQIQDLELDFIKEVVQAVGPENAPTLRATLLGNLATRGSGSLLRDLQDRPLNGILLDATGSATDSTSEAVPKKVFVTRFKGDTSASQVSSLREEVTAICQTATPGVDEALVVLQTGGGTVTGYGLAAAQLLRFKEAGLKVTIAVEQVAASGGYMMCCVADHIVASPFAVLGSIGVITDIPNVYDRLKQEGIEFQTVTAGKYKRTLTPTKKVTKEDFMKTKEDVEDILRLFRDFVKENRPQLDIETVATGETWFGSAALERKLCDEIKTVDGVIMDRVKSGCDVYEITYKPPVETPFGKLVPAGASTSAAGTGEPGILGQAIRWMVRTVASEIKTELAQSNYLKTSRPIEEAYMMVDESADRFKAQD